MPTSHLTSDVVLPMQDPYMSHVINGTKNYAFGKYCLKPSVKRIWFYLFLWILVTLFPSVLCFFLVCLLPLRHPLPLFVLPLPLAFNRRPWWCQYRSDPRAHIHEEPYRPCTDTKAGNPDILILFNGI